MRQLVEQTVEGERRQLLARVDAIELRETRKEFTEPEKHELMQKIESIETRLAAQEQEIVILKAIALKIGVFAF
jgi:hypothetical protein